MKRTILQTLTRKSKWLDSNIKCGNNYSNTQSSENILIMYQHNYVEQTKLKVTG